MGRRGAAWRQHSMVWEPEQHSPSLYTLAVLGEISVPSTNSEDLRGGERRLTLTVV
jgi:hypothetical protein